MTYAAGGKLSRFCRKPRLIRLGECVERVEELRFAAADSLNEILVRMVRLGPKLGEFPLQFVSQLSQIGSRGWSVAVVHTPLLRVYT